MLHSPLCIVGGGIAGLTLARCLRKQGIPAIVFDKATSSPRQSYAITLYPWAYRPLLGILDIDESEFRGRIAVDAVVGGTGRLGPSYDTSGKDIVNGTFRAQRASLESLLREGLDIKWGHTLAGVQHGSTDLELAFDNGERVRCDFVVGADGIHSQMRKSLLPSSKLEVLPYVVFNGKRRVDEATFEQSYAPFLKGSTLFDVHRKGALLQLSIGERSKDVVNLSYTYSRMAHEDDELHRPERQNAAAKDIPDAFYRELEQLSGAELPFPDAFGAGKVRKDRVLHWLMRTSSVGLQELQDLAGKGIILIGDAVHGQPILGGEGGNAAIRDGIKLAEHIVANGKESIAGFYETLYKRWLEEVQQSEQVLTDMHSPQSIGSEPANNNKIPSRSTL